jgi:hypothetical protein
MRVFCGRVELCTSAFAFFLPPVSLGALSTPPSLCFLLLDIFFSIFYNRVSHSRDFTMVDPDRHSALVPMGRLADTFSNDALTEMLASANKVAAARPQSASNDSDGTCKGRW